jgi:hypothetical protein
MANGFCRNGAAYREIGVKRQAVRHSRNSFDVSWEILALCRVFFATPNKALRIHGAPVWSAGDRTSRYDAAPIAPSGASCPPRPFNVR